MMPQKTRNLSSVYELCNSIGFQFIEAHRHNIRQLSPQIRRSCHLLHGAKVRPIPNLAFQQVLHAHILGMYDEYDEFLENLVVEIVSIFSPNDDGERWLTLRRA